MWARTNTISMNSGLLRLCKLKQIEMSCLLCWQEGVCILSVVERTDLVIQLWMYMASKNILHPVSFLETCIWSDRICKLFVTGFWYGNISLCSPELPTTFVLYFTFRKKKKRAGGRWGHVWNREVNECWLMAMSFPRAKKYLGKIDEIVDLDLNDMWSLVNYLSAQVFLKWVKHCYIQVKENGMVAKRRFLLDSTIRIICLFKLSVLNFK